MTRADWTDGHGLHLSADDFLGAVVAVSAYAKNVYDGTAVAAELIAGDVLRGTGPALVATYLRRIAEEFPTGCRLALQDKADELDPRRGGPGGRVVTASEPTRRGRPATLTDATRWAEQGLQVECFSGADPTRVLHRGQALGYVEAPTVVVRLDDGRTLHWVVGLCREAVEQLECGRLVRQGPWDEYFRCRLNLDHYGDCSPMRVDELDPNGDPQ